MKRTITIAVAGVAMLAATGVFAMMGMGAMNCGPMANLKPEEARAFFKETSDLRTEMMVKQIELRQENAKATPDAAKVEALQKEMTELRTRIQAIAKAQGLPDFPCSTEGCGMMQGGGMGKGGCGMMGQKGAMGKGGCGKMAGMGMGKGGCGMMGATGSAPAASAPAADQTHQH
jgi:hypothetical protein